MQAEDARLMRELIMGFRNTQLVYVAAKLGIADRLAEGAKSAADIAAEVGADPDALFRILRALATIGVFAESDDKRFELNEAGSLLLSNAAGSMRNIALLYGDEWLWRAYGRMMHSAVTGRSAFQTTHGQGFYEYLHSQPEAGRVFQNAMDDFSVLEATAILSAHRFDAVKSLVDIGSGQGALLSAILEAYPQLRGIAFDMPYAEADCLRQFEEHGLRDKAAFVAGDFFTSLPQGHDLYLLKSVLHNWDDEHAIRILKVCREAIAPAGRLLVLERVIDTRNQEARLFDVNMLVTAGGRERTEQQYQELLRKAGFNLTAVIPTACPLTVLEATPLAD